MANIEIVEVGNTIDGSVVEHIIIDNGDGSFTSMTKAHWDELQAKQTEGGLR